MKLLAGILVFFSRQTKEIYRLEKIPRNTQKSDGHLKTEDTVDCGYFDLNELTRQVKQLHPRIHLCHYRETTCKEKSS